MAAVRTKTYEVRAQRHEGWWVISVPEIRGVHSQARRLDQVEDMAKEALSLVLDVPEESFEVNVIPEVPDEVRRQLERVDQLRHQLHRTDDELRRSIEAITLALRREDLSLRDVGRLLGLSHQRVAQLVGAARSDVAGRPAARPAKARRSSQVVPPKMALPR